MTSKKHNAILGLTLIVLLCIGFQVMTVPASEPLTIGFMGDITGPVGFWNAPRIVGIQDAMEYMNTEFGGIGGRKVNIEWRDHKSNAGLADKYYNELKPKTWHIWHTCGTGEQQLLKPQYERDKSKIIFTCSTSPAVIYPVGHVFGTAPYFPDQFGAFVDWLIQNWDKEKMGRMPKVAFMTYSSGYGKSCITPETLEYARKKQVEIVDTIYIPFVTIDSVTPLVRAKEAGADWLFGQWLFQTVPPYLKTNKEKNIGLKFCVTNFGVDQVMISNAKEASEGLTGISSWYMPYENTPGLNLVNKTIIEKSRQPEDRGASYFLGWMNMWQTKMAVEQTLTRTGSWDKISPLELIRTLETWTDADINGLGRIRYSPTERAPKMMRIVQVRNGKWVPITDWTASPNLVPSEWMKPIQF